MHPCTNNDITPRCAQHNRAHDIGVRSLFAHAENLWHGRYARQDADSARQVHVGDKAVPPSPCIRSDAERVMSLAKDWLYIE